MADTSSSTACAGRQEGQELLFLAHRIPYPPDKGDKIRSFHLLRHLAGTCRVHVGAFVDDPGDWRHAEALARLAGGEVMLRPLDRRLAVARSAAGLLTGEPLTLPYYRDRRMQAWVDALLEARPVARALAYSSSMAQYLMRHGQLRRVIDFVDVDSDKWRQYALTRPWPMSWVYRREARTLLAYERRVALRFAAATLVSDAEAALFRRLAPESADKAFALSNGVDTDYFAPGRDFPSPYAPHDRAVVFTGAMDYWANVDAVRWFAHEAFPALRQAYPDARFCIVGARPAPEVRELARAPGVRVTGAVPDIRPYLAHAAVAVAPLRIARGIQNKVLEAMAMARPAVVSPQALEGIAAVPGEEVLLAEDAAAFVAQVSRVLAGEAPAVGDAARRRVLADFAWASHLRLIERLLGTPSVPAPQPAGARALAAQAGGA